MVPSATKAVGLVTKTASAGSPGVRRTIAEDRTKPKTKKPKNEKLKNDLRPYRAGFKPPNLFTS